MAVIMDEDLGWLLDEGGAPLGDEGEVYGVATAGSAELWYVTSGTPGWGG
jgi:hypothetical protein